MRRSHLQYLVCPDCAVKLTFQNVREEENDHILAGDLGCCQCNSSYQILRGVPRFVELSNYADGFDFQWNRHALTQHDSYSKSNVSNDRFFNETKWGRSLPGELILEVGCGSGRFTAEAISTGAMVVATDLSGAVDANFRVHRDAENVLVVQSDIYRMPFPKRSFDKLFCLGVLQHTPCVERSFKILPEYLRTGGNYVADVYDRRSGLLGIVENFYRTYFWVRPITRRMPPRVLYRLVSIYIKAMWPIAKWINKIPWIGRKINRMLLIVDYRGRYELSEEMLQEWSILDTFDMLSPAYDQRQTIETFRSWFESSPLSDIDVHYGYNGIEGRAIQNHFTSKSCWCVCRR